MAVEFGTREKVKWSRLQMLWHSALILSDKIGIKARDANPWKTMARFWMHDLGPTPEQCICCEEEELRRAGKPLALDSMSCKSLSGMSPVNEQPLTSSIRLTNLLIV